MHRRQLRPGVGIPAKACRGNGPVDAALAWEYLPGMSPAWLIPAVTVLGTVVAMELTATAVHRYIMHGWGWGWHRSHHSPCSGAFERNDLYALVFAVISISLFLIGESWPLLWWVGVGTVVYGLLYAFVHDGI